MLCIGLWAGMLKSYCHIWNQRPPIYLMGKFRAKISCKNLYIWNQNFLFRCFGQQHRKTFVIFEISVLQFALLQSFVQKIKIWDQNLGPKMPDLRIFGLELEHIWNRYPQICLIAKVCEILKCLNLGSKIHYLGIFGLELEKKTIAVFEISTLKFVWLQKFAKKQKCPNLGPNVLYLGIFELEFQKAIITFEISSFEFS